MMVYDYVVWYIVVIEQIFSGLVLPQGSWEVNPKLENLFVWLYKQETAIYFCIYWNFNSFC